jgi:hypothetical protein
MTRRRVRVLYVMWALTLVVVSWAIALVSAVVAGKGKAGMGIDSEAGIISE